jgi:iron complex transport system substrate-binding protein
LRRCAAITKLVAVGFCLLGTAAIAETLEPLPKISCERIVSLAPSATETLFALGLGKKVVGVGTFDNYPPEANSLPRVGGLLDPNIEMILQLRPSVVVALEEFSGKLDALIAAKQSILQVDHRSPEKILSSIDTIARACGIEKKGQELRAELQARIDKVTERSKKLPELRAAVLIGQKADSISLKGLYLSGTDGYYKQMLSWGRMHAINGGRTVAMPNLSLEGLIALDPDIVFHIVPDLKGDDRLRGEIVHAWQKVPGLRAVNSDCIFVTGEDFMYLPGPRFVEAMEWFRKARRNCEPNSPDGKDRYRD